MKNNQDKEIELTVIIKTLNEEKNIARCIEALLSNLKDLSFEVVIADSGSDDKTIEIASRYPITIVQLANRAERSCGIGPQLGFQHSHGEYILILDADMVLHASFVRSALARMKSDKRCGGIGGQLVECSGSGYEYDLRRVATKQGNVEVQWLDGGGIYRREAILNVGYISNRNLHAYEEKELGLRLRSANWHLYRFSEMAVDHYGHSVDTVTLLWRRWRSGYADACGESIRACFGKPFFFDMVLVHKALVVCLIFKFLLIASLLLTPWSLKPLLLISVIFVVGFLAQSYRKRGIGNGWHSILHLTIFSIGLVKGLFKTQADPLKPIKSFVLKK